MQRLEVSCAVRRIYTSLGAKGLIKPECFRQAFDRYSDIEIHVGRVTGTDRLGGAKRRFSQFCEKSQTNCQSSEFWVSCFIPEHWWNTVGRHVVYVVTCCFEQTTSLLFRLIESGEPELDLLRGCNISECRPRQSNVGFLGDRLNVALFFYSLTLEGFTCFHIFSWKSNESKCNEMFTLWVVYDANITSIRCFSKHLDLKFFGSCLWSCIFW